ncbi:MAG: helix-turn-helix domain-containing protein [Bacteroidia bacterium]|nr:helix-turn-helix domain-containing protein [Bacteroidia bacterium]
MNTPASFQYKVVFPTGKLAKVIHHYDWMEFSGNNPEEFLGFFPGFATGFLFFFDDKQRVRVKNAQIGDAELPACSLLPAATTLNFIGNIQNLKVFRVVFQPGGLFSVYKLYMRSFQNQVVDPTKEIDPKLKFLHEQMNQKPVWENCIHLFENYLLEKLDVCYNSVSRLFYNAQHILQQNEAERIIHTEKLAEEMHYSRRHLHRLMNQELGIKPVQFLRINRLCRVLQHIHQFPQMSIAQTALSFGYYDQAHFSHEFKQMIGYSPGQYQKILEKKTFGIASDILHSGLLIKVPPEHLSHN